MRLSDEEKKMIREFVDSDSRENLKKLFYYVKNLKEATMTEKQKKALEELALKLKNRPVRMGKYPATLKIGKNEPF